MRFAVILAFPLVAACGSMEQQAFELQLDPEDSTVLRADTNEGDVALYGVEGGLVEVFGTSVGRGRNSDKAREALATNRWGGSVDDGVVRLFGEAGSRGEVELHVEAPRLLSADVIAGGLATLQDIEGSHVATADRIVTRRVIGDADFYARSGGLDVEIWPYLEGEVRLQSHGGDVIVYLPYGADYDLQVFGDAEHELTVADLGFDFTHLGAGYFAGERGNGRVDVSIHVEGGSVEVRESLAR
ncbi:MAG: hypothetical protein KC912_17295 [Proteobacteria bacterium]|nr:hypothetical protein [Pseudomonadota bacterium]